MKSQIWHDGFNQYKERLQFNGNITLNLEFWDCECTDNYIHPITQHLCQTCGSYQVDSPSSREDEIEEFRSSAKITTQILGIFSATRNGI